MPRRSTSYKEWLYESLRDELRHRASCFLHLHVGEERRLSDARKTDT
jgi:hypothetical protein